jgi:hypothetical protein
MLINFKKYLLNAIYLENKKKIFYIYFLYIVLIIFSSIIYGSLLNSKFEIYDSNYEIILENVSFSNGELIYNLLYKNKYSVTYYNNLDFYLAKTPAIPFFIFFLTLFSKNFFYIIISKNLIIFTIYFYFVYKILLTEKVKNYFFLLILIIPIIIPYNFSVSLNFFYEDSLIAILLPLLFLALITTYKHKYLLISGLCFILYFVKTSMFLIIAVLPILIIFFERKKILKFLPVIFSLLAILIWGFYGLYKTGRFPIFSSSSSINSHVLAFAMNENFHKFYPSKSTDLIPISYEIPNNISNEWDFFDFYAKKNIEYLDLNLPRYLKNIIIKLKFIFFGINRDGALPDKNGNFDNSIRFSLVLSKLLFNLSILFSLIILFKNIKKIFSQKKEIFFLSLVILNLLPHIFVWATSKHLVAISNITMMYLIFCFAENKNKINL